LLLCDEPFVKGVPLDLGTTPGKGRVVGLVWLLVAAIVCDPMVEPFPRAGQTFVVAGHKRLH
jgi:hypothetical protein